jgi:hypothetical protein
MEWKISENLYITNMGMYGWLDAKGVDENE